MNINFEITQLFRIKSSAVTRYLVLLYKLTLHTILRLQPCNNEYNRPLALLVPNHRLTTQVGICQIVCIMMPYTKADIVANLVRYSNWPTKLAHKFIAQGLFHNSASYIIVLCMTVIIINKDFDIILDLCPKKRRISLISRNMGR